MFMWKCSLPLCVIITIPSAVARLKLVIIIAHYKRKNAEFTTYLDKPNKQRMIDFLIEAVQS